MIKQDWKYCFSLYDDENTDKLKKTKQLIISYNHFFYQRRCLKIIIPLSWWWNFCMKKHLFWNEKKNHWLALVYKSAVKWKLSKQNLQLPLWSVKLLQQSKKLTCFCAFQSYDQHFWAREAIAWEAFRSKWREMPALIDLM